jgi:hypothetical protein
LACLQLRAAFNIRAALSCQRHRRGHFAAQVLGKLTCGMVPEWWTDFFALRNVTDNVEKFYMVLWALSEANVDQTCRILEAAPANNSFRL